MAVRGKQTHSREGNIAHAMGKKRRKLLSKLVPFYHFSTLFVAFSFDLSHPPASSSRTLASIQALVRIAAGVRGPALNRFDQAARLVSVTCLFIPCLCMYASPSAAAVQLEKKEKNPLASQWLHV